MKYFLFLWNHFATYIPSYYRHVFLEPRSDLGVLVMLVPYNSSQSLDISEPINWRCPGILKLINTNIHVQQSQHRAMRTVKKTEHRKYKKKLQEWVYSAWKREGSQKFCCLTEGCYLMWECNADGASLVCQRSTATAWNEVNITISH